MIQYIGDVYLMKLKAMNDIANLVVDGGTFGHVFRFEELNAVIPN